MKLLNNSVEEVRFATSDLIVAALFFMCIAAIVHITILSLIVLIPVMSIFIIILVKEKFIDNRLKKV